MRHYLFLLALLLSNCARPVPTNRPKLSNQLFDKTLTKILPFKTKLVSVEEVYQNLGEVPIFDVRSWEEYTVSHLPTAVWMPYPDVAPDLIRSLAPTDTIILYCTVGYRSDRLGDKLQRMGYSQVYNIYGSIFAWADRDLPLVDSAGLPTNRIHTFNKRWSRWVANDSLQTQW